uniref:Uncharacterized protein n=1 Tax=Ixodes ricinus TaxID=34613 RepID=A0A6B0UB35_IXORI
MFGFERRSLTLWKKFFSVTISVDSALATNTKTSASRQCLSIHRSRFGDTSMPGLSTRTTSSLRRLHLSLGQKIRTNVLSPNDSEFNAFAS